MAPEPRRAPPVEERAGPGVPTHTIELPTEGTPTMIRSLIAIGAALAASAPALARPQTTLPLVIAEDSSLEWTGATTAGPLVAADTSTDLRGALRVHLESAAAGPTAEIDGRLRLGAVRGVVLDGSGAPVARAALLGIVLELDGAPTPATQAPGGGVAFDVDIIATYTAGSLALEPPAGPAVLVDLTGGAADDLRLRGRLQRENGRWRLAAPLRLQLGFGDPNGFGGVFRLQGPLHAATPCDPARRFCAQGPGAPDLLPLAPLASAPAELRFLVKDAPADAMVALFGGMAQAPAPAAAGDLCVGAPRTLLAAGTTGAAGAVVLTWAPDPASALSGARFAVQARVRTSGGPGARLTNGVLLRGCGE